MSGGGATPVSAGNKEVVGAGWNQLQERVREGGGEERGGRGRME